MEVIYIIINQLCVLAVVWATVWSEPTRSPRPMGPGAECPATLQCFLLQDDSPTANLLVRQPGTKTFIHTVLSWRHCKWISSQEPERKWEVTGLQWYSCHFMPINGLGQIVKQHTAVGVDHWSVGGHCLW